MFNSSYICYSTELEDEYWMHRHYKKKKFIHFHKINLTDYKTKTKCTQNYKTIMAHCFAGKQLFLRLFKIDDGHIICTYIKTHSFVCLQSILPEYRLTITKWNIIYRTTIIMMHYLQQTEGELLWFHIEIWWQIVYTPT